jgi:hypothetical protein
LLKALKETEHDNTEHFPHDQNLITVLILALNLTSSSYPCLTPFYYLLAFADEERTCVAELKEFQFT